MSMDDLEEKFTRCPQCRSYSIASTPSKIRSPLIAHFFKSYNHYHCRNCGLDFKQLTNEDLSIFTRQLHARPWKKNSRLIVYAILASVLIVAVYLLFFNMEGADSDQPYNNQAQPAILTTPLYVETPPISEPTTSAPPASDIPQNAETQKPLDSTSTQEIEPEPQPISGTIDLLGKTRFGANWINEGKALLITRLSEGPLFKAGLKVGDKITHLNAQPVATDAILLDFRNKLNGGMLQEGVIHIDRSGQTLFFKIISSQTPPKDTVSPSRNLLLFPETQLKIRNSAPNEESSSHRWVFNSTTTTITRKAPDKIFLSGHPDRLTPWAVDNIIVISKNAIPGLKSPITTAVSIIPEDLYREALDISDYFPANVPIQVTFSLVDLGIKWGNSNVFLVFQ